MAEQPSRIHFTSSIRNTAISTYEGVFGWSPKTLYGETAQACEEVADALMRESGGTTARATKIAAAKLGAIGTSAGIFGLAATVGTAGTGTAIGALSGAAATSATLAWIGGSVAAGSVVVGTAALAGGIGFAAGSLWTLNRYWRGTKRLKADLNEREQRVLEVTSKLAVACKRLDANELEPDSRAAKVLFEETLSPLCEQLMNEQNRHSDWPGGAIKRLRKAAARLNDIAMRLKHLGTKAPTFTLSVFATVTVSLLQGDISNLSADQELALDALRRSRSDLENASENELIAYVSSLSDSQLDGVLNNVKGIYHELLFVAAENSDGDIYSAALVEATNFPGADVILKNDLTGEIELVQLKATDFRSYITKHQDRYREFMVFATEEVAGDQFASSGFNNVKLTSDTEHVLDELRYPGNSIVDDTMATSAVIALALQLGRVIRTGNVSRETTGKAALEVTKAAFISGLVAWAIS